LPEQQVEITVRPSRMEQASWVAAIVQAVTAALTLMAILLNTELTIFPAILTLAFAILMVGFIRAAKEDPLQKANRDVMRALGAVHQVRISLYGLAAAFPHHPGIVEKFADTFLAASEAASQIALLHEKQDVANALAREREEVVRRFCPNRQAAPARALGPQGP